jgi:hypothetical protein
MQMGRIGCPEMSVTSSQSTLRKITERRSYPSCSGEIPYEHTTTAVKLQMLAQPTDITRKQFTKCFCLAPPEDEQVMLETC